MEMKCPQLGNLKTLISVSIVLGHSNINCLIKTSKNDVSGQLTTSRILHKKYLRTNIHKIFYEANKACYLIMINFNHRFPARRLRTITEAFVEL